MKDTSNQTTDNHAMTVLHQSIVSLVGEDNAKFEIEYKSFDGSLIKRILLFDISIFALIRACAKFVVVRLLQDSLRIGENEKDVSKKRKLEQRKSITALYAERLVVVPVSMIFGIFKRDPESIRSISRGNADAKLRKQLEAVYKKPLSDEQYAVMKTLFQEKFDALEASEAEALDVPEEAEEAEEK